MKKALFIFWLLIAVVSLSCKKSDNNTATGLKAQMVGKWNLTQSINNQYDVNGKLLLSSQSTYTGQAGDYIQFNSDGTFTQHFTGSNTSSSATYVIDSDTRFTCTNASNPSLNTPARVVIITANAFTYISEGPKYQGSGYTEITFSYTK
jgi:hypothetical protein